MHTLTSPWQTMLRRAATASLALVATGQVVAAEPQIDWQPLGALAVARTETTVGHFRRFVQATSTVTQAERRGGGEVYEAGWVRRAGWTWRAPFGVPAADNEPAVHVTFDEAQAFCRWAGGRLPRDGEWVTAAYTEQRADPQPFSRGRTYAYPLGDSPRGAQCLGDCGPEAASRALGRGAALTRGAGHAAVATTPRGVNGLYDMGGNAWEWVDEPAAADQRPAGTAPRRTRGGSWWYGQGPMRADHLQDKPADTAVVYIGFRCVRPN